MALERQWNGVELTGLSGSSHLKVEDGPASQIADFQSVELRIDRPLLGVDVLAALHLFAVDGEMDETPRRAQIWQPVDDQAVDAARRHRHSGGHFRNVLVRPASQRGADDAVARRRQSQHLRQHSIELV